MSAYEVDWDAASENRYDAHCERIAAFMEEVVEDMFAAYEPDDPKHPTYHDRLVVVWDMREGK